MSEQTIADLERSLTEWTHGLGVGFGMSSD